MTKTHNPLEAAETAAEESYRLFVGEEPYGGLTAALEAYRAVLEREGVLWAAPEPVPAAAAREAARFLASHADHNRYADPDAWQSLLARSEEVDFAYAAALRHLGRLGGDETTRTRLEAARRLLLDHDRTRDITEGAPR